MNNENVIEMYMCEVNGIFLRPDQLYIFRVDPNCEKCKKLDVYREDENDD